MTYIAHTPGITCEKFNDPFYFCHAVIMTTHKTLRGPKGGMILIHNDS